MTDRLQALLFPPREPGWLLDQLRYDWSTDFSFGFHAYQTGHYRELEIRESAYHAYCMLELTDLAARKNAEGDRL